MDLNSTIDLKWMVQCHKDVYCCVRTIWATVHQQYQKIGYWDFVFYTYLCRYIWVTKIKQTDLDLIGFKNYLHQCLKIQKSANVLSCLELINIDSMWR